MVLGAILVRALAAFFSEGYVLQQEHFGVIEPWPPDAVPQGSVFPVYAALLDGWFRVMKLSGIVQPGEQMMVVRFIHVFFSFITLLAGYRLARAAGSAKGAMLAFWLLAFAWILPFISVRTHAFNLAIPFVVAGVWMARLSYRASVWLSALAGILAGAGVALYPYAAVYWVVFVLITLFHLKPLRFILLTAGTLVPVCLTGLWLEPANAGDIAASFDYIRLTLVSEPPALNPDFWIGPLVLALVLGPPLGFLVLAGFLRLRKDTLRISLPALVCLLAATAIRDQAGLLIVAFPFIVITGSQSWVQYLEKSCWLGRFRPAYYAGLGYFWILNMALMFWFATLKPRQPMLDAMQHLSKKDGIEAIAINRQGSGKPEPVPLYYAGKSLIVYCLDDTAGIDSLADRIPGLKPSQIPAAVLFFGDHELKQRLRNTYKAVPGLGFEARYKPGITEQSLRKLIRLPSSGSISVYRNEVYFWYKNRPTWKENLP